MTRHPLPIWDPRIFLASNELAGRFIGRKAMHSLKDRRFPALVQTHKRKNRRASPTAQIDSRILYALEILDSERLISHCKPPKNNLSLVRFGMSIGPASAGADGGANRFACGKNCGEVRVARMREKNPELTAFAIRPAARGIFMLIEAHAQACNELDRVFNALAAAEQIAWHAPRGQRRAANKRLKEAYAAQGRFCNLLGETAGRFFTTVPATLAGAAATLAYVRARHQEGDWMCEEENFIALIGSTEQAIRAAIDLVRDPT